MHEVYVERSLYASLCYYCLSQLGFTGGEPNPELAKWSQELSGLGAAFSFRAPLAGGPLFTLLYQIPAYLDVQSHDQLLRVVEDLHDFVHTRSLTSLMQNHSTKTACWNDWYVPAWMEQILSPLGGREKQACQVITRFAELLGLLWSEYEDIHKQKLAAYQFDRRLQLVRSVDVFRLWADELGWDYPFGDFKFIICPESRSSASSLGPEKIVFGAKHDEALMYNSLIHEVGVRYFSLGNLTRHKQVGSLLLEDYEAIIKLVETEICFRKPRLMPDLKDDPFIRGMRLERLVAWRSQQQSSGDSLSDLASWYRSCKAGGLL